MAGSRVILSPEAIEDLKRLDPPNRELVKGVLDVYCEKKKWLNNHKWDLYNNDEITGLPVYATSVGRVWIAFNEFEDGNIWVTHLSILSGARPPSRPFWG